MLVEAAVCNHMLKSSKGIDPAQTFIDRQAHQLRRMAVVSPRPFARRC